MFLVGLKIYNLIEYITYICYSDIGDGENLPCWLCVSGEVKNCELCSEPIECEIGENFISAVKTSTEIECKEVCIETSGKGFFYMKNCLIPT